MGVSPQTYDGFIINKGAEFSPLIYYKDACGEPIDVSGYSASMRAKYKLSDPTAFLELTTSNGGITLGGAAGTIQVFMSDTATAALTAGYGQYSLLLDPGANNSFYILEGKITVKEMP